MKAESFVIILFLFLQYCEYYPEYEKCKQWLERNMPTEFERVVKLGKNIEIYHSTNWF